MTLNYLLICLFVFSPPVKGKTRDTIDRLLAATHFGELDASNNHVIAHIGSTADLDTLVLSVQTALGRRAGVAMCLDLQNALDVQKDFRHLILSAPQTDSSTYHIVVATGAEILSGGHSVLHADRARILDFLYLISDKSSAYRNIIVLLNWEPLDRPLAHLAGFEDQYLMDALQPLASDTFNPGSFVGRLLAVHLAESSSTASSQGSSLCRATPRYADQPNWKSLFWMLCFICAIVLTYYLFQPPVEAEFCPSAKLSTRLDQPSLSYQLRAPKPVDERGGPAMATRSHDSAEVSTDALNSSVLAVRREGRRRAVMRHCPDKESDSDLSPDADRILLKTNTTRWADNDKGDRVISERKAKIITKRVNNRHTL